MDIIQGKDFTYNNTCVTIGKFDGIHIGHRRILEKVIELSKQYCYKSTVFTFDFDYFKSPDEKRLNTRDEKIKLLEEFGIDILVDYPFDEETKNMTPEKFVKDILIKKLGVRAMVVGENFRFGRGAEGNVSTLDELGVKYEFKVYPMKLVEYAGSMVSSTRIREELNVGHMKEAFEMLNKTSDSMYNK